MQQKVKITVGKKEKTVILETDKYYFGHEQPFDYEKPIRRALGLPVTKQLIFYTDTSSAESKVPVVMYKITDIYEGIEGIYGLEIILENKTKLRVHSDYFAYMQEKSFIKDIAKFKNQKEVNA